MEQEQTRMRNNSQQIGYSQIVEKETGVIYLTKAHYPDGSEKVLYEHPDYKRLVV